VSDGGEFGQWAQACLKAPARIINGPAGAIGSALPFAAAAKLARPDATVVAMLGDGTFGFHMSEMDTAVRFGLDYIAVIGNDATWNAEYQIQLRAYGKARAKGCELLPTRYGAVAAAMGAHGEDVLSASELNPALARAATAGKPAVVNVMIERQPAPKY
jgi:acetolactate synthase-1/2/3 large subunit